MLSASSGGPTGSAPKKSASLRQALEENIRQFESKSGWHVSTPAQIVIHQGLIGIRDDHLGLKPFEDYGEVVEAATKLVDTVIPFLKFLSDKGEAILKDRIDDGEVDPTDKVLGPIFVMQHVNHWAQLATCVCWPHDPSVNAG